MSGCFSNYWTSAEEAALRGSYLKGGIAAAQKAIPARSRQALFVRAQMLGLKRRSRWTPQNDAVLRKLWGLHSLRQIAKKTGRAERAVCWRAKLLGLELGCQRGHEYLEQACRRTGFNTPALRRILKAGGVRLTRPMSLESNGAFQYRTVDSLDVDDAVAEWLKTEIVSAAASARDMSAGVLRAWLLAAIARGVVMPAPTQKRAHWRVASATIDAVIAWRGARESLSAAAARVGVSRWRLAELALEAGIERTRPWMIERVVVDRLVAEKLRKKAA